MISPSEILAYRHDDIYKWGCPLRYYLAYKVEPKLKSKAKMCLLFGVAVHEAIERFVKMPPYIEEVLPDNVYEALKRRLVTELNVVWQGMSDKIKKIEGITDREAKAKYLDARNQLDNWLEWFWDRVMKHYGRVRDWNKAVYMARPESEKTVYARDYRVFGRLDGLDLDSQQRPVPIDYKTGKRKLTPEIKLQMTIYGLLAKRLTGKMPAYAKLLFLADEDPVVYLKITDEMVVHALKVIDEHFTHTQSNDIADYKCSCGGRCISNFIIPKEHPVRGKLEKCCPNILGKLS